MAEPASLEGYYRQMAAQWRDECLAVRQENAELRKRAPGVPGLYRAVIDASGVLVVERLILAEGMEIDASELGY